VPRHECLCERLARFECGGGLGRADERAAGRREGIGNAQTERKLRTDNGEVDAFTLGERQQVRGLRHIGADASRHARDPGISRSAQKTGHRMLARQFPGNRVLTRARADDQDLHCGQASIMRN
jgi:hypothetical protein